MRRQVRRTVDTRGTLRGVVRETTPVVVTVPLSQLEAEVAKTSTWKTRSIAATFAAALGWGLFAAARLG